MSSFGFLNITGVDGSTSGGGGGGGLPGGINGSVQFNDGGITFGGTSNFLYNSATQQMTATKIKPGVIVDSTNSVGTAGQVLSSTGTALQYITPPAVVVPGAPSDSVQFNKLGVFTGNSTLTFTDVLANETLTVPLVKVRDGIEPITTGTTSIGTPAKRVGNINAVSATFTTAHINSIYDSTNFIGTTDYVLSNNSGNIVWKPEVNVKNYTAQFSADVVQPVLAGSLALVLQNVTFATGLDFALPPPFQGMEVLETGVYQCSYHVDFEGQGPGPGLFTTFLRRITPSVITTQEQRVTCHSSENAQLSDTFFISLTAGEIWNLQMTGTKAWAYKNIHVVFYTV
jgi:hypothetical protein